MSEWRPEHAAQVLTAYDVLRTFSADASPADVRHRTWYAARPPRTGTHPRWAAPVSGTARAARAAATRWSAEDTEVVGDRVRVLDRPGSVISEGWWRAWGGRWDPSSVPEERVRVYLRPRSGDSPPLTERLAEGEALGARTWLDLAVEVLRRNGLDPSRPHAGTEGGGARR